MGWVIEPWYAPADVADAHEQYRRACEAGTCGTCKRAAWNGDVGVCRWMLSADDIEDCWVSPELRARDMECDYEPRYGYVGRE
ncbi:MAG: hypothetical protein HFJ75_07620 [Eggerthellaceae bacterium]|nr:hypothetical protein [Eggerthellaceae bacterium]